MRSWPFRLGAIAVVVLLAGRLTRVEVAGDSMRPMLEPGDRLLVWRTSRVRPCGLVVVPDPRRPDRPLVKRVRGVAGGRIEVRGDNPAASTDSRAFGFVSPQAIIGRPVYRYHPPDREGRVR